MSSEELSSANVFDQPTILHGLFSHEGRWACHPNIPNQSRLNLPD
jgi:hypothetical protein